MNKKISSNILYTLLINAFFLMLVGCNVLLTPVTQLPLSTPTTQYSHTVLPPFLHYTSVSRSSIYLEFEYPSSWGAGEDLRDNQISIALYEPRYFTLSTPFPGDNHPPINDFGFISIRIRPLTPDESFEQIVEEYTAASNYYTIPLSNYQSEISGQRALVFEYRIDENNPEIYSSKMFIREIFFTANRLIYKIEFTLAEKDRGNEFEEGFQYFINSLKINP